MCLRPVLLHPLPKNTHHPCLLQPWSFTRLQVAWQAIVLISPALVTPFPGELYGRDSKNSCSARNWCHCFTTPQRFQRAGHKLRLPDRHLNCLTPESSSTERFLDKGRRSLLFICSFGIPAWVNVNSKCETLNAAVNDQGSLDYQRKHGGPSTYDLITYIEKNQMHYM